MRCYRHEAVMFPPQDCLECIRDTYGKYSAEYKRARMRRLAETEVLRRAGEKEQR